MNVNPEMGNIDQGKCIGDLKQENGPWNKLATELSYCKGAETCSAQS